MRYLTQVCAVILFPWQPLISQTDLDIYLSKQSKSGGQRRQSARDKSIQSFSTIFDPKVSLLPWCCIFSLLWALEHGFRLNIIKEVRVAQFNQIGKQTANAPTCLLPYSAPNGANHLFEKWQNQGRSWTRKLIEQETEICFLQWLITFGEPFVLIS